VTPRLRVTASADVGRRRVHSTDRPSPSAARLSRSRSCRRLIPSPLVRSGPATADGDARGSGPLAAANNSKRRSGHGKHPGLRSDRRTAVSGPLPPSQWPVLLAFGRRRAGPGAAAAGIGGRSKSSSWSCGGYRGRSGRRWSWPLAAAGKASGRSAAPGAAPAALTREGWWAARLRRRLSWGARITNQPGDRGEPREREESYVGPTTDAHGGLKLCRLPDPLRRDRPFGGGERLNLRERSAGSG
jgi:hypothetical protein